MVHASAITCSRPAGIELMLWLQHPNVEHAGGHRSSRLQEHPSAVQPNTFRGQCPWM